MLLWSLHADTVWQNTDTWVCSVLILCSQQKNLHVLFYWLQMFSSRYWQSMHTRWLFVLLWLWPHPAPKTQDAVARTCLCRIHDVSKHLKWMQKARIFYDEWRRKYHLCARSSCWSPDLTCSRRCCSQSYRSLEASGCAPGSRLWKKKKKKQKKIRKGRKDVKREGNIERERGNGKCESQKLASAGTFRELAEPSRTVTHQPTSGGTGAALQISGGTKRLTFPAEISSNQNRKSFYGHSLKEKAKEKLQPKFCFAEDNPRAWECLSSSYTGSTLTPCTKSAGGGERRRWMMVWRVREEGKGREGREEKS